jgi:aldose 1-epimerase
MTNTRFQRHPTPQEAFVRTHTGKLVLFLIFLLSLLVGAEAKTTVKKESFGKTKDGAAVELYTLTDGQFEARIITYGGTVISLKAPDRKGHYDDVVLGFDSIAGYEGDDPYFGALIGRYGNRIAKGKFTLDGKTYTLATNNGPNSLHGGKRGFDKRIWAAKEIPNGVELKYVSKDGEEGYPGTLTAIVRYTLVKDSLKIDYSATTDKDTVLNLTNHSYFNLAGQGNGDILSHEMKLNAAHFTPVDDTLIPTGKIQSVAGTPFDFRAATAIGKRINDNDEQLKFGKGYDHNWVLDGAAHAERLAAEVYEAKSGRVMQVWTDQPGIQFYTGNFLDGSIKGKAGKAYPLRSAFCLETQHFPDSPNHKNFPSTELKPKQVFHSSTTYKFLTR